MSAPAKNRQPGIIVFVCGIIFSGLVLRGVDYLFDHGTNIMGWYAKGIIPAGALIVGIGSGLGYALGSRFMNVKLTKGFIWGMVVAGLVDYVAAQYVTYTNLLERYHASENRYSFLQYLKDICENMTFTSSSSHEPGSPLGAFGYVYKLLEMAGFTFGYIIPSAILSAKPYCPGCQLYLKKHQTTYVNSPVQQTEVKKMKKPERMATLQGAVNDVAGRGQALISQIKDAPFADTAAALAAQEKAFNKNAAAKLTFTLSKCPKCDAHHLDMTLTNFTVDKKVASKSLLKLDKTKQPVAPVAG